MWFCLILEVHVRAQAAHAAGAGDHGEGWGRVDGGEEGGSGTERSISWAGDHKVVQVKLGFWSKPWMSVRG